MLKQPRHITKYWSFIMVAIVLFACFGKTLQFTYINSVVAFTKTSYMDAASAQPIKPTDSSKPSLEKEPCKLATKLLNYTPAGWEQFSPLLMLFLIIFAAASPQLLHNLKSISVPILPKRRIHLNYCIFRE